MNLGKWNDWGSLDEVAKDYTLMQFDNGQKCWNGPKRCDTMSTPSSTRACQFAKCLLCCVFRSVRVKLACGVEDAIVQVEEPNTCEYEMTVETPLACTPQVLRQAQDTLAFWS